MRNRTITFLAVVLTVATLAWSQGGNPPASTKESGATSGKGMAAAEQTAEGSHDPSRLTYARLYCTPDGNSHFENVTVDLRRIDFAPPAAPLYIGGNVPASARSSEASSRVGALMTWRTVCIIPLPRLSSS
jgi:hypothetical protein